MKQRYSMHIYAALHLMHQDLLKRTESVDQLINPFSKLLGKLIMLTQKTKQKAQRLLNHLIIPGALLIYSNVII